MKNKALFFTGLLVLLRLSTPVFAATDTIEGELEKIDLELKLNGIKYLRAQKKELATLDEMKALRERIGTLKEKVRNRDLELEGVGVNLEALRADLQSIDRLVAERVGLIHRESTLLYKTRVTPYLNSILGSRDIPGFIFRYHLLKVMLKRDRQLVGDYTRLREQQRRNIEDLSRRKSEADSLVAARDGDQAELNRELEKLKQLLEQVRIEKQVMGKRVEKLLSERDQARARPVVAARDPQSPPKQSPPLQVARVEPPTPEPVIEKSVPAEAGLPSFGELLTREAPLKETPAPRETPATPPVTYKEYFLRHGEKSRELSSHEAEELLRDVGRAKTDPAQALEEASSAPAASASKVAEPVPAPANRIQRGGILRFPVDLKPDQTIAFGSRELPTTLRKGLNYYFSAPPEVLAVAPGRVLFRGNMGPLGRTVIVNHLEGLSTLYAGLESFDIRIGQTIGVGDRIGQGGLENGRYRLHFEVRKHGTAVDPAPFLEGEASPNRPRSPEVATRP